MRALSSPSLFRALGLTLGVAVLSLSCGSETDSSKGAGGSSGSGATAATGGTTGSGGSAGVAGAGGSAGAGGASGSGGGAATGGTSDAGADASAGTAGSAGADAGKDAIASDASSDTGPETGPDGCTLFKWCRDSDGDQQGDPNNTQLACTNPTSEAGAWSTICTDCADNDKRAFKGQTICSGLPYPAGNGGGYDFDCDGAHKSCQSNVFPGGKCSIKNCGFEGYLPNTNPFSKSATNQYCGSTEYRKCQLFQPAPGQLGCQTINQTAPPFECK